MKKVIWVFKDSELMNILKFQKLFMIKYLDYVKDILSEELYYYLLKIKVGDILIKLSFFSLIPST
jgi:hypothetical protein